MIKLPQIPGYLLIRKLGQGGMADVFLGIQENLQREVAIKVLESSLFRDDQFSERFKNEALTAAKLSHPNIITIHDIGQIGDTYYIVMEYLPESLKDRMQRIGIMPPREALDIIKMIASALDYAHNKGFIHRDIKPDNIMFRSDGTAVLVDFGIARAMDSTSNLTRSGTSIGTPYYMSPEQCRGEKIDGRSDIYALGVQLYQLLTGKLPYKAENSTGIILKHIQDPVPRLPKELYQYQILLDKMMAKDKEMRIAGGAELVKFIDAFLTAQDQKLIPMPDMPSLSDTIMEIPTVEQTTPLPHVLPHVQPAVDFSFSKQPERKKWLRPSLLALAVIILTVTTIHFLRHPNPVNDTKSITGKESGSNASRGSETQKINNLLQKTEQPIAVTKSNAGPLPVKGLGTETPAKDQKAGQESPGKVAPTPKNIFKNDTPASSLQMGTSTISDLHPDLRNEYNSIMEQLQIPLLYPNLKIMGQVAVVLAIDEKGKIRIQNYQYMVLVTPLLHEKLVKLAIGKKINGISLPLPKNKKGEPISVNNWRIIYKAGKSANKIILSRQNKS